MAQLKANGLIISKQDKQKLPTSLRKILNKFEEGSLTNCVTLVGAGISTAAGIPDFRSPSSGLYDKLKDYNLPFKTAIFDASYFEQNPEPLYRVLRENFLDGQPKPTKAHFFVKLLEEKGILRRHYSQNIDGLDRLAGLSPDKLVEVHGSLQTGHCCGCEEAYTFSWIMSQLESVPVPKCNKCSEIVRPDIILFGEYLSDRIVAEISQDAAACDLLIVMGTSLVVHPIASLVTSVPSDTLRLFINKSPLGDRVPELNPCAGHRYEFPDSRVWVEGSNRDAVMYGESEECVDLLVRLLGWKEHLQELLRDELEQSSTSENEHHS